MRIFISYAHQDLGVADALAVGLSQDHHQVFFDRDRLRAGDEFHANIRRSIGAADLFIFLVSPDSVEPSSYALTELGFARQRWPNPSGRVLPVIVRPVPLESFPAYLGAVTFLESKGNLTAAVLGRIAEIAGGRRRARLLRVGAVAVLVAVASAWGLRDKWWPPRKTEPCYLQLTLRPREPGRTLPTRGSVEVSFQEATSSFPLSTRGEASIHVGPLTSSSADWRIRLSAAGEGTVGEAAVSGCPPSRQTVPIGAEFEATLVKR